MQLSPTYGGGLVPSQRAQEFAEVSSPCHACFSDGPTAPRSTFFREWEAKHWHPGVADCEISRKGCNRDGLRHSANRFAASRVAAALIRSHERRTDCLYRWSTMRVPLNEKRLI